MTLVQHERLITLATPLGKDVLFVETLEGSEGISRLFRFQLVLLSEKADIPLNALVGQRVTFSFELAGGKQQRYLNGFVSRFAQGDVDKRVAHYYMEVIPWLWFLTRTTDCRIFQRKTVPDIIQQIFKDLGFTDFKLQLQSTFQPREYCVQYRETDFNFVSRLMEEEGIFYYFEHSDSKHVLVLGNEPSVHQPCPNQPKARYAYTASGNIPDDTVTRWHIEQEFEPGKYTLRDYYFETPDNNLQVSTPTSVSVAGNSKFEVYDYPGYFAKRFDGDGNAGKVRPDGERTAKLGMQGEEAFHKVATGASSCRAFVPGYKFELTEHRRAELNGPYVLTQVSHSATNNLGDGEGATYDNTFTCIPAAVPFRPAKTSPKPVVHGSQTAVVVGTPGEEIDCDKYGRVKVQFYWDREGKKDQNSSCWIRVAQQWAGKGYGMNHVPRIGNEVVIAFLEGDPDQPIIIGSVYNADQTPPYPLPANKMVQGIRSNSTPGGGGFNGLIVNDTKGKELITLHGQKDMSTTIEHDDTQTIIHDRNVTIHGKLTETIDKDTTIKITQGNLDHDVVAGKAAYHVQQDITEKYSANQITLVGGDLGIGVGGGKGGGHITIIAAEEITITTGDSKLNMKKNGTITLTGKTIKTIATSDITDSAPNIAILGSKTAKLAVGSQNVICDTQKVNVGGAAINSSAVGMHEITGALVKIN